MMNVVQLLSTLPKLNSGKCSRIKRAKKYRQKPRELGINQPNSGGNVKRNFKVPVIEHFDGSQLSISRAPSEF